MIGKVVEIKERCYNEGEIEKFVFQGGEEYDRVVMVLSNKEEIELVKGNERGKLLSIVTMLNNALTLKGVLMTVICDGESLRTKIDLDPPKEVSAYDLH